MVGFIFDAARGETPESLKRKREIAQAILASQRAPRTIGEGLNALGDGIVANVMGRRADEAERAGLDSAAAAWAPILGAFGGGFPERPANPSGAPHATGVTGQGADTIAGSLGSDTLGDTVGDGWLRYANQGATRNQPISGELQQAMSFLPELGVTMEVFSGGQDATGPNRVGSHRHDHGGSGDVFFYRNGRRLDWANPADVPVFQEIVRQARANGVTGFGAGPGYMRPGSMHIGFGAPAVWGAGGSGRNAPQWLRDAYSGNLAGGGGAGGLAGGAGADTLSAPNEFERRLAIARGQMPPDPAVVQPTPETLAPVEQMAEAAPVVAGDPIAGIAQALAGIQGAFPGRGAPAPQTLPLAEMPVPTPRPDPAATSATANVAQAMMAGGIPTPTPRPAMPNDPQPLPDDTGMPEMAGNTQPIPRGGPDIGMMMQALQNPWLNDGQRSVIGALLEQQFKAPEYITGRDGSIFKADRSGLTQVYGGKPDPADQLAREKFEFEKGNAGQTDDIKEFKQAQQGGYQGTFHDWQLETKRAGASNVSIDQRAEGAFEKKAAELQATMFGTMVEDAVKANADLATISELDTLLANQGGALTGLSGMLAKYGIGGEGVDDLQAAQALINKLVPTQRPPGSGSMSDRDVELFTRSLPSLWNKPGGNQKILRVMRGLAEYRRAQGEIAFKAFNGLMTRPDAMQALQALPNPLARTSGPVGRADGAPPEGVTQEEWDAMTPEDKALWN